MRIDIHIPTQTLELFDDNGESAVLARGGEADFAAFRKAGDAVLHGVFDKWLKQQRREQAIPGIVLNAFLHA